MIENIVLASVCAAFLLVPLSALGLFWWLREDGTEKLVWNKEE